MNLGENFKVSSLSLRVFGGLGPDAQIVSACVEILGQRDSALRPG